MKFFCKRVKQTKTGQLSDTGTMIDIDVSPRVHPVVVFLA